MRPARLEHLNFTVADARKTADLMCRLFGWKIRWQGETGYEITSRAEYVPGRRFYFFDENGVEFEVVSYA